MKKILSAVLALAMAISMSTIAFAEDEGFSTPAITPETTTPAITPETTTPAIADIAIKGAANEITSEVTDNGNGLYTVTLTGSDIVTGVPDDLKGKFGSEETENELEDKIGNYFVLGTNFNGLLQDLGSDTDMYTLVEYNPSLIAYCVGEDDVTQDDTGYEYKKTTTNNSGDFLKNANYGVLSLISEDISTYTGKNIKFEIYKQDGDTNTLAATINIDTSGISFSEPIPDEPIESSDILWDWEEKAPDEEIVGDYSYNQNNGYRNNWIYDVQTVSPIKSITCTNTDNFEVGIYEYTSTSFDSYINMYTTEIYISSFFNPYECKPDDKFTTEITFTLDNSNTYTYTYTALITNRIIFDFDNMVIENNGNDIGHEVLEIGKTYDITASYLDRAGLLDGKETRVNYSIIDEDKDYAEILSQDGITAQVKAKKMGEFCLDCEIEIKNDNDEWQYYNEAHIEGVVLDIYKGLEAISEDVITDAIKEDNLTTDADNKKVAKIDIEENKGLTPELFKSLKTAANGKADKIELTSENNNDVKIAFDPSEIDTSKLEGKSFTPSFRPEKPAALSIEGTNATGGWIDFDYSGDLPAPMTITMKINPEDYPNGTKDFKLWHFNTDTNKLEAVNVPVTYNEADETVTFTVEHFSVYAVYEAQATPVVDNSSDEDNTPTDTTSNTSYTKSTHNKTTTTDKIEDVAKDLADGDKLTIKLTTKTKTVSGDVLKEIKGKDVDVKVEVADGIEWSFNGEDIPENWDAKDINFNLDTEKSEVPADTLKTFTAGKKSKTLSLDYDGEFGFTMQLSVHIGYLNDGQYANIYYYNPETKALEFKESSEINSAGNAKFDFKHASDYVILVADEAATASDTVATTDDTTDNTDSNTDTNESNPVTGNNMALPMSAVAILSVSTLAVVSKKHKR